MTTQSGSSHEARKRLFSKGVRRGWVSLAEVNEAAPEGSLSPVERWLLFYSLRAAGVDVREERGDEEKRADSPEAPPPSL